ncbi:MAG: amidohydrolase family protein [Acidobacteriota bacterium]|nr:amidohydrolase family protein [Acidobacteriota bacterium]
MVLLAMALLAMCGMIASARAEGPGVYAIRDARIVTVSGSPIERGTVVIRDGLIESAGENVTPPADAWVIDGKGLTVYPGLIDALSSWGLPSAAAPVAPVASGRGAPRPVSIAPPGPPAPATSGPEDRPSNTSYLRAADQVVASDKSVENARNAGFTTAVTFPTSNIFSGQGAVIDLAGNRTGQMIVESPAGLYLTMKPSGFTSYPGSLMGVFAYVRQIYLDAGHYKLAKAIYDKHPQGLRRPAYDRTLEGVIESPRVLLPAQREVEVDRMLRFADELKIKPVLYGGDEAYRSVDLLRKSGAPMLISLKWPERAKDADPKADEPLRILEVREKSASGPAALARGGVRFAFYSDGIANPKDMLKAVKKSIDAGLSPADAVRAMTLSPAEIYGVADRLGSIDRGKIANLVVTDGDLFQDKTKVKYVFIDGSKFEPLPETDPKPESKPETQTEAEKIP